MKPDTETALTALWARDLLIEAGLPAEVFQVVLGEGPVVGPEVVKHADYVSFTGSTRTGREVAQGAAARLVGVSLELGGKNAMLVLHDADIEKAAAGAVRACFSSAGQLCISIERLYVHESIADAFVERFAARTKAMRLGNVPRVRRRHGLPGRRAPAGDRHPPRRRGRRQGRDARRRRRRPPRHRPATSTSRPSSTASRPRWPSAREETFGPVVSIYRFTRRGRGDRAGQRHRRTA